MASSAVRLATRSSSCCCCATSRSYFSADALAVRSRSATAFSRPCSSRSVRSIVACRSDERRVAADQRLLERLRLLPLLARLLLGFREQLVRLFLGFEQRFFLAGFGVALGVLDDAERLLLGAADGFGGDTLAVGDPDGEHGGRRHQGDQDVDQVPEIRQHA